MSWVDELLRAERDVPHPARLVALLAGQQGGNISHGQLRDLGYSASAIGRAVRSGRLHARHRGVYAVGHLADAVDGVSWAALLAAGPKSALSHLWGAAVLRLVGDGGHTPHVTVAARGRRSTPSLTVHCVRALPAADVIEVRGMRVTSAARALLDCCESSPRRAVERMWAEALFLGAADVAAIDDVLSRSDGRRGAGILRAIVASERDPGRTRSELEEQFLALVESAGLPRPEVNARLTVPAGTFEVDFLWRERRLVVETDGQAAHGTRSRRRRDARRDVALQLAGYRPVRLTWEDVTVDAARTRHTLRALHDGGG